MPKLWMKPFWLHPVAICQFWTSPPTLLPDVAGPRTRKLVVAGGDGGSGFTILWKRIIFHNFFEKYRLSNYFGNRFIGSSHLQSSALETNSSTLQWLYLISWFSNSNLPTSLFKEYVVIVIIVCGIDFSSLLKFTFLKYSGFVL